MQTKDNLEKIRKACISANPEILALKFGCKLQHKDYSDTIHIFLNIKECGWMQAIQLFNDFVVDIKLDKYKVIGRPIQLADVLLALDKSPDIKAVVSDKGHFRVLDNCLYGQKIVKAGKGQIACDWNLKKPLEEQSKETIDFIAGLL